VTTNAYYPGDVWSNKFINFSVDVKAAFLAGYVAAKFSETGIIGFIGSSGDAKTRKGEYYMRRKLLLLITTVTIILFGLIYYFNVYYMGKVIDIDLEYIGQDFTNGTYRYWFCIVDEDHLSMYNFDIEVPENDFNENYLIYSFKRKMIGMSIRSEERIPYRTDSDTFRGHPIFGDEYYPNSIFFYRIPKIKIFPDDKANGG
jgi:hypothetical protein